MDASLFSIVAALLPGAANFCLTPGQICYMLDQVELHMHQRQDRDISMVRQEVPDSQAATRDSFEVNPLAAAERQRLFKGLERFVNNDDSLEEYKGLSKGFPGFWPRALLDERGNSLAWHDECHALFLVFRNGLRHAWTPLPDMGKRGTLAFLLGIGGEFQTLEAGGHVFLPTPAGLNEAWDKITSHHPSGSDTGRPLIHPRWTGGDLAYIPSNDFQAALHLLWRESWRAKVCAKCSTYFVASKPAQLYCGTACSGGVKRERTLKWWRDKGAKRRAATAKSGRKPAGVSRSWRKK